LVPIFVAKYQLDPSIFFISICPCFGKFDAIKSFSLEVW